MRLRRFFIKTKNKSFYYKISKIYTPSVIILALLTTIIPFFITGEWNKWKYYLVLTFLVIKCPCVLVLRVLLTYISGIIVATKLDILFKGANAIEAL